MFSVCRAFRRRTQKLLVLSRSNGTYPRPHLVSPRQLLKYYGLSTDPISRRSDTHSMSSISQDLARLETTCFEFYRNSVLSALAVPDVLEGEDPIAISYDQIEKMAVDSWTYFEPFFKPVSF